jgi:hypothetical protein
MGRVKVIRMFTSILPISGYGVILLREDQFYNDVHRVPPLQLPKKNPHR